MAAHDAGERVAVGDGDPGEAEPAAAAASSSGCEAPRRKEKFEAASSSA